MPNIKEGSKAPSFALENQTGEKVALKDIKEDYIVVFFYPKDNTPGCTTQACDIRDNIEEFNAIGVKVYGVSGDSKESHQKFIEKKGEGVHHIAFATTGVQKSLNELAEKGVQLIDKAPRKGAEGLNIAFLHPKSTVGVLTELCEDPSKM